MQALEIDLRDAIGLEPAVEVVEAPEGLVRLGDDVPAPVPIGIKRELAFGLDAAAEIAVGGTIEGSLIPHAGKFDAVGAARQAMAPIAQQQRSRLLRDHRREGEIVVIREGEIVGDLERVPQLVGMAIGRHEEARLPLHRRVGHLEPGHVDDRHAQEVEEGILVGDDGLIALMRDLAGANPPGGGLGGIRLADFARREPSLLEHRDVACLA